MKSLNERIPKKNGNITSWRQKKRNFTEYTNSLKGFVVTELVFWAIIAEIMILTGTVSVGSWAVFVTLFLIFFISLTIGAAKSGCT